jgi:hypothetical protein
MAAGSCAVQQRTGGSALWLDAVRPDSVVVAQGAVVEVLLRGRGFAPGTPGRNTVVFGTLTLNNVPANTDGTEIRLVIPDMMPSGGEAAPMPTMPGPYEVRVRTAAGESNAATVRVYR